MMQNYPLSAVQTTARTTSKVRTPPALFGHGVPAQAGCRGYLALALASLPAAKHFANVHVSHLSIAHPALLLGAATGRLRFRSRDGSILLGKWLNPFGN